MFNMSDTKDLSINSITALNTPANDEALVKKNVEEMMKPGFNIQTLLPHFRETSLKNFALSIAVFSWTNAFAVG